MKNARHMFMHIQAVIGSHQRTEREIDDFCSWIEVQVMTELFAAMPEDKQQQAINQFMTLPPDKKESVFYPSMVRTKSGGDSTVRPEFVITGMIFHPSRVQSELLHK
jgi:hypothetical protein